MTTRRATSVGGALVVALFALVACGSDDLRTDPRSSIASAAQEECDAAVASIVSATGRYVRGYESGRTVSASSATGTDASVTTTTASGGALDVMTEAEFQAALATAEGTIRGQDCDRTKVRADLTTGLQGITPKGPVADAVLRQLAANLTGRAAPTATVTKLGPGDDLRDALASSPDGSTLELEAGEYHLDAPLVALTGLVIHGAGRDATTIVSTAPDAAVLVLTDKRVELNGLTVRHDGDSPASVVLGGPASSVVLTNARVAGGRIDPSGQGGAGVLMYSPGDAPARGTTLEATDVEVSDNEAAGIVLTGTHRSSIVRATIDANGQCGLCYIGGSSGSVEDSTLDGNGVGVAVTGTASPSLLRITISGGEVGLQVSDTGAPALAGGTISGSARAAVIYSGPGAGSLDSLTCANVPFGIVVHRDAHPHLGKLDGCEVVSSG